MFSSLYKTPSSGSLKRTNLFTAETCDENHTILQLKDHMKG